MSTKTKATHSNRVLPENYRESGNFFTSDRILRDYLRTALPEAAAAYMTPLLQRLGRQAATTLEAQSLVNDKQGPELVKRNKYGETINEIRFHPAYWEMMRAAVESEMMRVKWEPQLRNRFGAVRHHLGFAAGMLFAMAESSQYCPLCMTDGVALLIDRFCSEEDRARLLPRIYTDKAEEFFTGAMFLTEKAGGSDVGANLVEARHIEGATYSLHGEKWFCSNVNADIIFALARTPDAPPGTRGLSIFLVEKNLPDGRRNPIEIVRLKDKLGTRGMASAECLLDGTIGTLVGKETEGFRIMAEMINLSRLYNSVAAVAGGRRALVAAYEFVSFRHSFGQTAIDHALVRAKLWELGALHLANFHMVWRAVRALDAAAQGDDSEAELLRLLTPMLKRETAENAVYTARESMELMGGMGYIEDTVVPKVMRDVMVLPIWEGAGNIMLLDMLRALRKSRGLSLIAKEITEAATRNNRFGGWMVDELRSILEGIEGAAAKPRDELEYQAKGLLLRLTKLYQVALLIAAEAEHNGERIGLAVLWLVQGLQPEWTRSAPPTRKEIDVLMGWEF